MLTKIGEIKMSNYTSISVIKDHSKQYRIRQTQVHTKIYRTIEDNTRLYKTITDKMGQHIISRTEDRYPEV